MGRPPSVKNNAVAAQNTEDTELLVRFEPLNHFLPVAVFKFLTAIDHRPEVEVVAAQQVLKISQLLFIQRVKPGLQKALQHQIKFQQ